MNSVQRLSGRRKMADIGDPGKLLIVLGGPLRPPGLRVVGHSKTKSIRLTISSLNAIHATGSGADVRCGYSSSTIRTGSGR